MAPNSESTPPIPPSLQDEPITRASVPLLKFLVIDDNPDGRFLVSKTILRKFPDAMVVECQSAQTAFDALRTERVSGIILHRTFDFDGASLVRELRQLEASIPIIMLSGVDRKEVALAAGASCFLLYDQWLMIGNVVAGLLGLPAATVSPASISRNLGGQSRATE